MGIQNFDSGSRGVIQCENTNLNLLKANDFVAKTIRQKMVEAKTLLINITSSAGSGKTTLMQKTAEMLKDKIHMFVLVGDLETERDAERIRQSGIRALQIVTGGICHLEAQMVLQALENIDLENIDLLFVENVGNLVCPASFDLGEDYRVTMIATTEGDDKPKKYPKMFLTSDVMLISKSDLLPYLPFSIDAVSKDALDINHELEIMTLSSLNDDGMEAWRDWLLDKVKQKQNSCPSPTNE